MGFTPVDQRHPKGSDDCSSRVMQVPLQSLGRRVAPPGDDSSHPKGVLETCGLIWRLSSFSAGNRGHLAERDTGEMLSLWMVKITSGKPHTYISC